MFVKCFDNKDKLERLAEMLIEKSRLEKDEMHEILLYGKYKKVREENAG